MMRLRLLKDLFREITFPSFTLTWVYGFILETPKDHEIEF